MKRLTVILCVMCLAPVTRKGAEQLMLMAKKGQKQAAARTHEAATQILLMPETNTVTSIRKALALPPIVKPPPIQVPVTNLYLTFKYDGLGNGFPINEQSNVLFQIAWTTNLVGVQHYVTNAVYSGLPRGWSHYCWTPSLTNTFRNTNREAYFICRTSNTITHFLGGWATKP